MKIYKKNLSILKIRLWIS